MELRVFVLKNNNDKVVYILAESLKQALEIVGGNGWKVQESYETGWFLQHEKEIQDKYKDNK